MHLAGYVELFVARSGKYSADYLLQRKPLAGYRSQFKREDRTLSDY
jgi:hypothetical protein